LDGDDDGSCNAHDALLDEDSSDPLYDSGGDDAAAAAAAESDSSGESDVDAQPHVRRSNGKWIIAGRVDKERFCVEACPSPFADVGEYTGIMLKCDGVCGRWYVACFFGRTFFFFVTIISLLLIVLLRRYHGGCLHPPVDAVPADKKWYCSKACESAATPMEGIAAGQAADPRPLRARVPTMPSTAIAPELRQRGLKCDGRVDDMRARLLAWLELEARGEQRLRSEQERQAALNSLEREDLLTDVLRRGLLAPIGEAFARWTKQALVQVLAAFYSTPQEFVVESERLGWTKVPEHYVHSPLPPFPARVGPRPPINALISEQAAFALLMGIPEGMRAGLGGHADLFDLIVRGGWCVYCV
jgi:hypothetical protein